MEISFEPIVSAFDPNPIVIYFNELVQQEDTIEVNYLTQNIVLKYQIHHTESFSLNLQGVLKSLFENETSQNKQTIKILTLLIQLKRGENILDTKSVRRLFVLNATEHRLFENIRPEQRLAPNTKGQLTYFKGFPQVDSYLYSYPTQYDTMYDVINTARFSDTLLFSGYHFNPRMEISREIKECGVFLRWRNSFGGWSYWLFSERFSEEIKTKSLGQISSLNYYERRASPIHLGFKAEKLWHLTSEVPVFQNELQEIKSLFTAQEVYLFIGERSQDHDLRNELLLSEWQSVAVVEGSHKIKINDHATYSLSVSISLGEIKTHQRV